MTSGIGPSPCCVEAQPADRDVRRASSKGPGGEKNGDCSARKMVIFGMIWENHGNSHLPSGYLT
jgi:hypothetical protein